MRKLTPYEKNQLLKYGFDLNNLNLHKIKNKPVEYITGFCDFYKNEFVVNKNVLIPRIETEQIIKIAVSIVEKNLTKNKKTNLNKINFCDIGTGSGAIGISLAVELEKLNVPYLGILSDVSIGALKIAKKNKQKINKSLNLKIIESNLLSNYPKKIKFNLIIANLPYIPKNRLAQLNDSVIKYEPQTALFGGRDGLVYIKKLIKQSKKYLAPAGFMVLEVDDTHTNKFIKNDPYLKGLKIKVIKDIFGKNRFWLIY